MLVFLHAYYYYVTIAGRYISFVTINVRLAVIRLVRATTRREVQPTITRYYITVKYVPLLSMLLLLSRIHYALNALPTDVTLHAQYSERKISFDETRATTFCLSFVIKKR